MSKYRTMAQPGSFGAGQLKTNDKKQRDIINTMNDTSQAMKENQSFLESQQELYFRAQQFAQGEEQKVREMNFETETDSRERLRESIALDYQTQIANEETRSKQRLEGLKGLENFSKTAFKLGSDVINDGINKRRQAYSALIARTGLDGAQLREIQALDNNLTESAFMQSQAIIDLKASGASDEDINAIYQKVYKDSGSLAWVDNKAVARNSLEGFELALVEAKAANPTASGTELKTIYNTLFDTYTGGLGDGSGRQFTPEFLETTINGKLRSALNRKIIEATQQEGQENLSNVEVKLGQAFDNTYRGGGGANGLMSMLEKNPNSRKSLVKWLKNSLQSGAISGAEVESILKSKLINYEGGDKRFIEAFGGTAEVADLVQSVNTKYRNNAQRLRQRQANAIEDANNEILTRANAALEDGVIDKAEFEAIKAWAQSTGLDLSKLTALERVRKDTKGARERTALEAHIQQLRKDGNWNLETMRALDLPNDLFTKYESYAIAGSKIKTDPKVKGYKETFRQMLANNTAVIAKKMQKSASVSFMANKFTDDFRNETQAEMAKMANAGIEPDFDKAAEVASKTIERKISEFIKNPINIDNLTGEYTPFVESFKDISDDERARKTLKNNINTAVQTKKWDEVYKALDEEAFIEFQQQSQGQVNPVAELIAATMNNGLTAEQVHNKIAQKFGLEPLDTTSQTRQSINDSIPKILDRYAVFDRVEERRLAWRDGAGGSSRRGAYEETGAGTAAPDDTNALVEISNDLGINPIDLATIIGFETGGTYNPDQPGGEGGRYYGLIQFGPSEQRQYGIVPGMSFRNQLTAVAQFLRDRFGGVGMETQGASLEDLYTTVLTGNPQGNRNARDSNGTSAISGVRDMGAHREAAMKRYGLK